MSDNPEPGLDPSGNTPEQKNGSRPWATLVNVLVTELEAATRTLGHRGGAA